MFDFLLLEIKALLVPLMILSVIGIAICLMLASIGSKKISRWGTVFFTIILLLLSSLNNMITVTDKNINAGYLTIYPFIKTQEHKYYEKEADITIKNITEAYIPDQELPVGEYHITVTLNQYQTHSVIVDLTQGKHINVYVRMLPVLNKNRLDVEAKTKDFKDQTNKSLMLLKQYNNVAYNIVKKHVDNIKQSSITGVAGGMLTRYYPFWETYPSFNVGNSSWKNVPYLNDSIWYAGVIAHDSYHAKQYDDAPIVCLENQDWLTDNLPANWLNENTPERKATPVSKPNIVCSDPLEATWRGSYAEKAAIKHQINVLENIPGSDEELRYLMLVQQECNGMHFDQTNTCMERVMKLFKP